MNHHEGAAAPVKVISPTIGRVVWYMPAAGEAIKLNSNQPLAAIVTYVHSDSLVNLAVFDPNGVNASKTSVTLLQPNQAVPEGQSFCQWMPYQVGQAAKAEAAEAKLAEVSKSI